MMSQNSSSLQMYFDGSFIKVIALLSMTIDHVACYLLPEDSGYYYIMRTMGRMAFPIYALLVAEGFFYTRNQLRYFLQLVGFALVSEIPWYMLSSEHSTHNVLFSLALGVVTMAAVGRLKGHPLLSFLTVVFFAALAFLFEVDYGWRGIVFIVSCFLLRRKKETDKTQQESVVVQSLIAFALFSYSTPVGSGLASLVLLCYNGKRGFIQGNTFKYFFYAFYPIHLFIIWLIRCYS